MNLKERLHDQMKRYKLTAKQLAAQAGISVHTLNTYLGTRSVMPSAEAAVKLGKVLGVSVEYLMFGITDLEEGEEIPFNGEENDGQHLRYLKGKGQLLTERADSKISNEFIQMYNSMPIINQQENPEIAEISAMLRLLSPQQLEAFHNITESYIQGVIPHPY